MHKRYIASKSLSVLFIYFLSIILIFFFYKINIAYGANNNWVEVSKTTAGIQYIDIQSITNKDIGIVEISTKYIKIDTDNSKEIEENLYTMRINCINNKFKDISVNGKKNLEAKWEVSNGDRLIIDVISDSCKNV
tara:strand:+ start:266 stop:670 length:405 start_codon:yes stop_codon:yes gene_type:complete